MIFDDIMMKGVKKIKEKIRKGFKTSEDQDIRWQTLINFPWFPAGRVPPSGAYSGDLPSPKRLRAGRLKSPLPHFPLGLRLKVPGNIICLTPQTS